MKKALLQQIGGGGYNGICWDADDGGGAGEGGGEGNEGGEGGEGAGGEGSGGGATEWLWSEGVPGVGDPPEWYKADKYGTVAKQAEAYPHLEGKLGAFAGAPDEYEVKVSAELAEKGIGLDGEDVMVQEAMKFAKDAGMNQEGFEGMLNLYSMVELAKSEAWKAQAADEMKVLGQNGQGRVDSINKWLNANMSEELVAGINSGPGTAAGVKAIEHLIGMTKAAPLNPDGGAAQGSVTKAELEEMQFAKDTHGNRKIQTDKEFKAEYDKKMKQFYGEGDHNIVVGG